MKKRFAAVFAIGLAVVVILCGWNSVYAESAHEDAYKETAVRPFEGEAGAKTDGLTMAQVSSTSTTGEYDVNKSTGSATSGSYDVNKSTTSSQGSGQNTTEEDKNKDKETSTSDRVKNSPKYTVPNINKRGSYAQGK